MKFIIRRFATAMVVMLCVVMSACGQKGKLVMPPNPAPVSMPYPVAPPVSDPENRSDQARQPSN